MITEKKKFHFNGFKSTDDCDPIANAYRASEDFKGARCCDNKACQLHHVKHPSEVSDKELRLNIGSPGTWHGDMDYALDSVRVNFSRKSVEYHGRVVNTEVNGIPINGVFCEQCYSVLELMGAV